MKLTVNSKETEVKDGCTVAELSTFLALPEKGIAIAVNNRMVPRIEWEKCVMNFKADQGYIQFVSDIFSGSVYVRSYILSGSSMKWTDWHSIF